MRSNDGPNPRWPRVAAVGLVALLPLLAACQRTKNAVDAQPAPTSPPPAVVVAELVQKTVPISSEVVARTEAVQTVEIRARVEGVPEQVLFQEGFEVKAGQVLFTIERRPYEAALQSARAQLTKARVDLIRAQESVDVQHIVERP